MSVMSSSRSNRRAALRTGVRSNRKNLYSATFIEQLEVRRLLSDVINTPTVVPGFETGANATVPAGQDTVIPITSADSENLPLTYQITSSSPDFTVTQLPAGTFIDMQVTDGVAGGVNGDLVFELFNSLTPNTAASITGLVESNFYNGITFSRIVSSFVAQAGSLGGGTSYNPGYTIPDEFNSELLYDGNGQLGMARTSDNDSNSTQFFITQGNQQGLNLQYTIFGQLVAGFSTFNQIMNLPTGNTPANPTVTITDARVIQDDTDECILVTANANTPTGASGLINVTATDGQGGTSAVGHFEVNGVVDTDATVDDPPFLTSAANNGLQFNYTMANAAPMNITLSAFDIYGSADTFSASITGSTTSGNSVSVSGDVLTITAASGFVGAIPIQVTVSRSGDSNNSSPDTRSVIVNVGPTTLTADATTSADPNSTNTFTVATFTDTNADPASAFTATVAFDTGLTPTTATITDNAGVYSVIASNVYPNAGTYTAIVSVTDTNTSSVILTFNSTVTVAAAEQPVYRLYNSILQEHLITTDPNEESVLVTTPGWTLEGTPFDMYNGLTTLDGVEDTPLYRLYDTSTGQHLWTADLNEYNVLRLTPGWNDEGIAGYVFLTPDIVNVAAVEPLYRLDYPFIDDLHLFTTDSNEVSVLTSQDGWVSEGIACYVLPS